MDFLPPYLKEGNAEESESVPRFNIQPVSPEGAAELVEEEPVERFNIQPISSEQTGETAEPASLENLYQPGSYRAGFPDMEAASQYSTGELSKQRSQRIRNYGGIDFDDKQSFLDRGISFDLARSDTFEAKQRKFKEKYPEGDIKQVTFPKEDVPEEQSFIEYSRSQQPEPQYSVRPNVGLVGQEAAESQLQRARASYLEQAQPVDPQQFSSTIVARKSPDEPYREIPAATGFVSEILSEPTVGSMVAGARFGPIGAAVGFFAGEMAKQTVEQARGFENLEGIGSTEVTRALTEGAAVGILDAASRRVLRGLGYSAKNVDVIDAVESFSRIERRSADLGVEAPPALRVGQVGSELTRAMYRQSALLGGTATERAMSDAQRGMFRFLAANKNDIPYEALSDQALSDILETQQRGIITMRRPAGPRDRYNMGLTLRSAYEGYKETSKEATSRMYSNVRSMSEDLGADLSWDLTRPISQAGGQGQVSIKELAENNLRGTVARASEQAQQLGRGEFIENLEGELARPLRRALENVRDLPDNVGASAGQESIGYEQMKAVRTAFFNIKEDPNILGSQQAIASQMWSELTDLMQSPNVVANRAEDIAQVTRAWREASESHAAVEKNLSTQTAKMALNDASVPPEALARRYAQPGRGSELRTIKETVKEDEWKNIRTYLYNELGDIDRNVSPTSLADELSPQEVSLASTADGNQRLANANWALSRLNRFSREDPMALRLIMSEAEENQLRQYLVTARNLESSPAARARETLLDGADRAQTILNRSSPSELRQFIGSAGGMESAQGYALRSAVYRDILENSIVPNRHHREAVSLDLVRDNIAAWRKSGKLEELFSKKDWQILEDVQYYSHVVSGVSDVGGGIQRGEVIASAAQAPADLLEGNYGKVARKVFKPILSARAMSTVLAAPAVRNAYKPIRPTTENLYSTTSANLVRAYRDAQMFYGEDTYEPEFSEQINRLGGARTPAP